MELSVDDLYTRALELSSTVEENFLDLGRYLRQLADRDPDKLEKVIAKSDLGSRKMYYLVDISRAFDGLTVPKARLKKIGWTKLSVIAKKVTQGNVEELLEIAETSTVKALEKRMKGEDAGDTQHCVLMYFSPKDYETFEEALVKHGGMRSGRGIVDKEKALMRMVEATLASKKTKD